MNFEQVLKEVLWRLVTEGSISYRRIKLSFGLDDDGLEELRRELIGIKRLAADVDGELLVWAPEGRAARPEPMALPQPLPALRHAEKPTAPAAERDLPAAAPVAPAAVAAAPEAERRQLTVMFCDLVGSTALSTGMDPEDLRDVIASYQSRCSAAIRRYDGFVAKYMGDGILVYFGYPRAHEDEAERSVRAGLDIVDAMAELNAAIRRPPGVELAVRIGIATGPVIVGDQIGEGTASETAVVGETPNLAARLQALAQPNQIVVSAATRAMLGDHFDLEDLGASELKGFAEPVPAWRVLSARDVESRFAATRTGSSAPLVGRQEEMGLLLRAWDGSSHGRGQVVLIQGEAGVGKSRLVEGLREAAGKDHIWVAIRCSPFHTASAFHPIIEHLKRVFGWQPEDTAPQHLAKLEAGLAGFKTLPLSESVRLFADLMSVPVPEDRYPRLVDDGAAAARCDPRCDRCLADRNGRAHPGADGMGGFALGRSDDIGNVGHADRAGADGGDAGRRDLSAGIDAALAATLAHDADHAQPPGAAGGRDDGRSSGRRPVAARRGGRSYRRQGRRRAALRRGADQGHPRFGGARGPRRRLRAHGRAGAIAHPGDIAGFADGAARSGAAAA